ncbi:MAG: hypothetical protein JRJ59_05490 [Deltaproteobacteria bacterium]|nr:hypothetical protein [Deltaproteobacteria bacterium]
MSQAEPEAGQASLEVATFRAGLKDEVIFFPGGAIPGQAGKAVKGQTRG